MTTRINTKIFVKAINNAASLTADPYRYVTHPKLLLKLTAITDQHRNFINGTETSLRVVFP